MGDEFRALYEDIIDRFEDRGWHVANAHRREAWGAQILPASRLTSMDFQDVSHCDVFVATPGADPMSPGTHIEIGWASALGKKIFLLTERGRDYAALVTGLPAVSDVTFLPFTIGRPVGAELCTSHRDHPALVHPKGSPGLDHGDHPVHPGPAVKQTTRDLTDMGRTIPAAPIKATTTTALLTLIGKTATPQTHQ